MATTPFVFGSRPIKVGAIQIAEKTVDPASPVANTVTIYAIDNGAGKTMLLALFPTGAPQQLAIEP